MGIVFDFGSLPRTVPTEGRRLKMKARWMARGIPMVLCALMIYAVWNIGAVRQKLIQAETYQAELIQEMREIAAENQRLEAMIAKAEDPAVIERMARTRLGLVRKGEIIFCYRKEK